MSPDHASVDPDVLVLEGRQVVLDVVLAHDPGVLLFVQPGGRLRPVRLRGGHRVLPDRHDRQVRGVVVGHHADVPRPLLVQQVLHAGDVCVDVVRVPRDPREPRLPRHRVRVVRVVGRALDGAVGVGVEVRVQRGVEREQVPLVEQGVELLARRDHDDVAPGGLSALERGQDARHELGVVVDVGPVGDVDTGLLGELHQGGVHALPVHPADVDVLGPVREVDVGTGAGLLHRRPPLRRARLVGTGGAAPRRGGLRLRAAGREEGGQPEGSGPGPRVPEEIAS